MPLVPLSQLEDALTAQSTGDTSTLPVPVEDTLPKTVSLDEAEAFHDTPVTTADAPQGFFQNALSNIQIGLASVPHMIGAAAVFMGDAIRPKGLTDEFGQMVEAMPPEMREEYTAQVTKETQRADTIGKSFIKNGYTLQDNVNKFIAQESKKTEGADVPKYVQELEQMGGGMAALIGTSLISAPLAIGGMSVGMAAETYQKARLKGKDFEDATKIGAAIGIVNGTPAFVGLGAIMKLSGPIINRLVGAALIQGGDMALMKGGTETIERFSGISESKAEGMGAVTEVVGLMARDASMAMILSPATGMAFAMQKRGEIKTELKKAGMKDEEAVKTTDAILAKSSDIVLKTVETEHKLATKGISRTEEGAFVDIEGRPVLPERVLAELTPNGGKGLPIVEQARLKALEALPQRETLGVTEAEKALVEPAKAAPSEVPAGMTRLYRVEPKDLGNKGEWLKQHMTKEQFDKFVSERGRLFSDNTEAIKNYGWGEKTHNSLYVDVPSEIARSIGRPHPDGFTEYLLPEKYLAQKKDISQVSEAISPEMTRKLDLKFQKIEENFKRPEAITKQRIKALQSEVDTFIRSSDLEAADKAKFLATIKQVQTFQQLRRVLPEVRERINGLVEKQNLRDEIARFQEITARKDVNKTREEYQGTIKSLIENLSPTKISTRKGMALEALAKHIQDFPETILPKYKLEELASLDKKSLRDMSSEEVGLINDAIEHLYKLNDAKTRILGERKYVSFEKSVAEVTTNIKSAVKAIKADPEVLKAEEGTRSLMDKIGTFQGLEAVKPETILMTAEGKDQGAMMKFVFNGINQAKSDYLRFERAGQKMLQEGFKGLDLEKWSAYVARDPKKIEWETFSFGKDKLKINKAQIASLYLLLQREGGARHLLEGGFSVPGKEAKVYKMTVDDAEMITDYVIAHPELQKATETLHSFFNGFMKGSINRVAYALTGIHIAKEPNYFKIKVNPLYVKRPIEQQRYVGQVAIEGMGFLKEAVPSKLPIMLEDAFSVAYESLHNAGMYVSYAEPLRAAKSILRDTRVRLSLAEAGKAEYLTALDNYIRRVEGEITTSSEAKGMFQRLFTNVQAAILMVNPSILAKQHTSVLAGLTEMDAKFLLGNYGKPLEAKDIADLERFSPQLFARWNGHISRELGELRNEGAIRELFTGKTSWSEKFMAAYQYADHPMVSAMWRGAKAEVMEKFPDLKGLALMEKVAERAEFMVRRTQAAVYIEHRSAAHAEKDLGARSLTMFSSETNAQYDMLVRGWREYLQSERTIGDQQKLASKVFIVSYLNAFLIANINAAANVYIQSKDQGRKDEEKKDWEMIGKKWVTDVALGPLSAFYVARDISNVVQSYLVYGKAVSDISNPALQVLTGIAKGIAELTVAGVQAATGEKYKAGDRSKGIRKGDLKWTETAGRGIKDLAENIGAASRIPVSTVLRWGAPFIQKVGEIFD